MAVGKCGRELQQRLWRQLLRADLDEEVPSHRHAVTLAVSIAGRALPACVPVSLAVLVLQHRKPSASRVL
jgi:hypothetical protein